MILKRTNMIKKITRFLLTCSLLLAGEHTAIAAPEIKLGATENYCVTYCYIRVPFTISGYGARHKIGRVFCDFDVDIAAKLPVYGGETRTKKLQTSTIGVFKSDAEPAVGDVEISTGVIKNYFMGAKINNINCHL